MRHTTPPRRQATLLAALIVSLSLFGTGTGYAAGPARCAGSSPSTLTSRHAGPSPTASCPLVWRATSVEVTPSGTETSAPPMLQAIAAYSSTDMWAVGAVATATLIEHWDGVRWRAVHSPSAGQLLGVVALSSTDMWAVGAVATATLIEHWDGVRWSVAPDATQGTLSAIAALTPADIWAVGRGPSGTLVEHWDGAHWSVVPSPSPGAYANALLGVAAVATDDVWAVGQTDGPGYQRVLIEHWNGHRWSTVPRPTLDAAASGLRAVAAISSGDVWAVGYAAPGPRGTLFEHWDGRRWSVVSGPREGAIGSAIAAVSARDVWAAGNATTGQPLLQHWDGAAWTSVPGDAGSTTAYPLTGLAVVASTNVWVVGTRGSAAAAASPPILIEQYAPHGPCPLASQTVGVGTATPATPSRPTMGTTYFPTTRHTMGGPFLSFWRTHGGLELFGNPRTEPFVMNARWMQVTDRFALERVGTQVRVAPLGRLLTAGRGIPRAPSFRSTPSRLYFGSTGHSLSGGFLTYWRRHDGPTLIGAPISEVTRETNGDGSGRAYLVQWFENGRLEYHPELAGSRYGIEVGLTGKQVLQQWGWLR